MYVKICDNCNDVAAIGDQNCTELEFTYDRDKKHFCSRKCLYEYLSKEEKYEMLLDEMSNKIIEILGKEKIDQINQLVNDVEKHEWNPSGDYSEKILRGKIVDRVLREIINEE